MKNKDLFLLAGNNLIQRKLRTFLTVVGIAVGTACIIVMLAVNLSNVKQIDDEIKSSSAITEIKVSPTLSDEMNNHDKKTISSNILEQIRQINGVKFASFEADLPATISIGKYKANISLCCIEPEFFYGYEVENGRNVAHGNSFEIFLSSDTLYDFYEQNKTGKENLSDFSNEDWTKETAKLSLGYEYEEEIKFTQIPNESKDGKDPENGSVLKSKVYKANVVGFNRPKEYQMSSYPKTYISLDFAKKILKENRYLAKELNIEYDKYNSVALRVKTIDDVKPVMDAIKEMGYEPLSEYEMIQELKKEQNKQYGQLLFVALISVLVSAIGISNTMLTSVIERKNEIGIMKVIGLSMKKIKRIFIYESMIIGIIGGLAGCLIGHITAFIINGSEETVLFGTYLNGTKLFIPFWLTVGSVCFAVAVSAVAGLYPAWRATETSPLQAIRNGVN